MKTLLVVGIVALSIATKAYSACDIQLLVKNEKSKSARLAGVSISAKQIEALKTVCNVTTETMSDEELVEDFKASLARKALKASKTK